MTSFRLHVDSRNYDFMIQCVYRILPKARVVYCSATGVTDVKNMVCTIYAYLGFVVNFAINYQHDADVHCKNY